MGFPRQEYWSGWPFPSPGDLPDPGIEPMSPTLAGRLFTTEPQGKPTNEVYLVIKGDKLPAYTTHTHDYMDGSQKHYAK